MRGLYHIRYDVLKPTKFNRLAFFQLGADNYNNMAYAKIARGNVNGQLEEWETGPAEGKYQRQGIPIEMPVGWISMHKAMPASDPNNKGGYGTRGIIVRSWDARLGGKATGPFASVYGAPPRAIVELSAPPQVSELLPGDYVDSDFEMTILPNKAQDYYGPNEALHDALEKYGDTAKMVEREAIGNNIQAKALAGKVTKAYPLSVQVNWQQRASVEVSGGVGYLPITFTGLKDYRGYELWLTTNSGKTKVDQSVHGNDYWQTDYDYATKTWSISYNVPMDELRKTKQIVMFDFAKPK